MTNIFVVFQGSIVIQISIYFLRNLSCLRRGNLQTLDYDYISFLILVTFNENYEYRHKIMYLSGVIIAGFLFLLCSLAVSGFPITPSFIGEDLIYSHIHEDQIFLSLFISISLIMGGLALGQIYSRIFMGPYIGTTRDVAE